MKRAPAALRPTRRVKAIRISLAPAKVSPPPPTIRMIPRNGETASINLAKSTVLDLQFSAPR